MVEFALSSLLWLPILMATIVVSLNLVRAIRVSQLTRDTAHMYAYGVDFTQSQNYALLQRLSSSLGISSGSGSGAIVLSKITLATQSDCDAANMKICPNKDKYVFTSLFVFGNKDFAQTKLGSPAAHYYSDGTAIQAATYLSDSTLVAGGLNSLLTFASDQPGQYAYVSEVTLKSENMGWTEFGTTGSYARSIF